MAQFVARDRNVLVNGETVFSVVDGMGTSRARALQILASVGIPDPKPGAWYPQQAWLDAFKLIAAGMGGTTLYNIGLKIPENARFPPELDSLAKALPAIDIAYHMNHRGGEIGHYKFIRTGDRAAKMVCDNPYPCDFDRGIIAAFCVRFKPEGSDSPARLTHDTSSPCRKTGADSCTYLVSW
jgi:hypothetical protein